MNMVLGEVEETVTTMEVDEETFEEMIKVTHPSRVPLSTTYCTPIFSGRLITVAAPCPSHGAPATPPCLQQEKRAIEMLFVRGDGVILVSPPLRTGM